MMNIQAIKKGIFINMPELNFKFLLNKHKFRTLDNFMIFKFFNTLIGSFPVKYLEAKTQYEKV